MAYLRNFGHDGLENFNGVGINGKNSEFHAAMGLANLNHIPDILQKRKHQADTYRHLLRKLQVTQPNIKDIESYNHSYFPVIFPSEEILLESKKALELHEIAARRYFFPSLNNLDYTEGACPISDQVAARILCLPLYHTLSEVEQKMIARILLRVQNN
jgi:dTDP-4-amino-4,6-dideoxygalactose transaminase